MKKTLETQREVIITVDEQGQILSEISKDKYRFNFKEGEPKYVKLYMEDISRLYQLTNSQINVLLSSLKLVEYGTNVMMLNKFNKNKISKETGLSDAVIRNSITKLTKINVFKRIDTGVYQLNPYIFGSGTWKDIKGLRMTIDYTNEGKEVKSVEEIPND